MLGVCRVLWLSLVIGLTQASTQNAGLKLKNQDLENLIIEMAEQKQEVAEQNQTITDMEKAMACFSLVMTQSIAQNELLNQKIRYLDNVITEVAEQNQTSTDMEKEMAVQKQKMAKQKEEMTEQNQEVAKQKQEMAKQKEEMAKQKQEMTEQKQEVAKLKQEMADQAQKMAKQNQEVAKQNHEMAKLKQKQATTVMFSAWLDHEVNLTAGKVVVFNRQITNVGKNYDTSTGVFTCTVPGYYVFDVHVMGHGDDNSYVKVYIRLNGHRLFAAHTTKLDWQSASAHVGVLLHRGNKVDVVTHYTSHLYGDFQKYNTFSGHLVNPL